MSSKVSTLKDIPIFILVGGLGTRLSSVVNDVPKPMASVAGRPFLEHLIKFHASKGFKNFIFLTGYMSEVIENHFKDGSELGVSIAYSVEKERLGTGGAIKLGLQNFPTEYFFLINGDTFSDTELDSLCKGKVNTLAIVRMEDTARYGTVCTSHDGRVTEFKEKEDSAGEGYINTGSYFLAAKDVMKIETPKFSLENVLFPELTEKGSLYAVKNNGSFLDIGIPEDYLRCESFFNELGLLNLGDS